MTPSRLPFRLRPSQVIVVVVAIVVLAISAAVLTSALNSPASGQKGAIIGHAVVITGCNRYQQRV